MPDWVVGTFMVVVGYYLMNIYAVLRYMSDSLDRIKKKVDL